MAPMVVIIMPYIRDYQIISPMSPQARAGYKDSGNPLGRKVVGPLQ